MKVYNPCIQINVFDDWFRSGSNQLVPTDCLADVLAEPYRIAFLPVYFNQFQSVDHTQFDLIVLSDIEFYTQLEISDWANSIGLKNYLLALGGFTEYPTDTNIMYRPWWMFNLMSNNQFEESTGSKEFLCDALLGCKKLHRDFIMANFQVSGLLDSSIVTYRSMFNDLSANDITVLDITADPTATRDHLDRVLYKHRLPVVLNNQELKYPYTSPNLDISWEINKTKEGYSQCGVMSQCMPWDIYRHTKYTAVAETLYFNRHFFLSEKTAKPMLAKRLFVVFSSYGYLNNLRMLGFKTFSGIIDESYDLIENAEERFKQAFAQLEFLNQQDPEIIKQQIEPIVEHNYNHMFTLRDQTVDKMKQMVNSYLPTELIK